MKKTSQMSVGIAALLGLFLTASIVEAQRPRSSIDRRQRPGQGFWQKTPSTNSTFSSNRSMYRSSPQGYSNFGIATAPRTRRSPQVVTPSQRIVTGSTIAPRVQQRVGTSTVYSQPMQSGQVIRGYVVSPAPSYPTVISSPTRTIQPQSSSAATARPARSPESEAAKPIETPEVSQARSFDRR